MEGSTQRIWIRYLSKENKVVDALTRIQCEVYFSECSECNKKYTQATNLGINKRIVHKGLRYQCRILF